MSARGIVATSSVETAVLQVAPVIFLLFWSGGFSAGKIGVAYTRPMTFLVVRYGIVLLLLAPLLLWKRPPLPASRAEWIHLAVVGVLIQGFYFALSYVALSSDMSSAAVAMIVMLQPVLVALVAPRLAGEIISRRTWIGLGLGLFGTVLVIMVRSRVEAISMVGVIAAFGALACITAGTMYEKRHGVGQHPVTANAVQYAAGLAVALPFALLREDLHVEWSTPFVLALTYLVVCNSLVAMTLLLLMIRHGEVSRVRRSSSSFHPWRRLLAGFSWAKRCRCWPGWDWPWPQQESLLPPG